MRRQGRHCTGSQSLPSPGSNSIELQLENKSGTFGLRTLSAPEPLAWIFSVLRFLVLALLFLGIIRRLGGKLEGQLGVRASSPWTGLPEAALLAWASQSRFEMIFNQRQFDVTSFISTDGTAFSVANRIAEGALGAKQLGAALGYPLIAALATAIGPDAERWFQWAISSFVVFLGWRVALRAFGSRNGLCGLAILAFHFPLIYFSGLHSEVGLQALAADRSPGSSAGTAWTRQGSLLPGSGPVLRWLSSFSRVARVCPTSRAYPEQRKKVARTPGRVRAGRPVSSWNRLCAPASGDTDRRDLGKASDSSRAPDLP